MAVIEIGAPQREELTQRQRWSHYFVFIYAALAIFIGYNLRVVTLNATVPYVNSEVGIRAAYPQRWLIDTGGSYIFRVRDLAQLGFKTSIQVDVQPVSLNTSARNLLDALSLSRVSTLSGYRVLSRQPYTLPDEQEATSMVYVYVSTDDNPFLETVPTVVEGMDILTIRRGQAIIVTFLSDADTFDENLPTFERFLDDLEF
ncbi:MAG: hypothetical protein IT319_00450 [Anaerolineae bacterium]|nr:hypothetical protein [Anaerolineae bacterium]